LIPLNTPVKTDDFVGDGSEQIEFPIPFPIFNSYDIVAEVVNPLGVVTTLTYETHFTLSSIGIPNTNPSLTLIISPSFIWTDTYGLKQNYTLKIKFSNVAEQPAKLRDLGRFAPEVFEKVLDRLTMNILAVKQLALDVQEAFESIDFNEQFSDLAEAITELQEQIDALPVIDLTGYATEQYVDDSIAAIPPVDLTGYATEQYVNTGLATKQNTITGGATTITSSNLTANRALLSDASGKVAVSAVTNTQLGYLSGVTSEVQSQINALATVANNAFGIAINNEQDILELQQEVGSIVDYKTSDFTANFGRVYIVSETVQNITLPNFYEDMANKKITIKKQGSNPITIIAAPLFPYTTVRIDNVAANKVLTSTKESVTLITDGAQPVLNWYII
jgi:hypothetical protein